MIDAKPRPRHERVATTPVPHDAVIGGELIADCSCGAEYRVSMGGDEYGKLEAAHRLHMEPYNYD